MSHQSPINRRTFLQTSATAGVMLTSARTAFGAGANERLRVGLIGCGGRGVWLSQLFQQNAPAEIVTLHDYFKDQVDAAGKTLDIPEDKRYIGLDGYREMLETDIDAVAIISPPYFHPTQTVDALEAGKHVYLAKPIAVDVPGCNAIVEAANKADGKLSCLVDFQTRNNEFFRGAANRVHEGMIGNPVAGTFHYHTGRLGRKTYPDTPVGRLRAWVYDIPLSGDIIVEQNIHVLDVANWYLQGNPVKAEGTGGQKARTEGAETWDHYVVRYEYPNDVLVDFASTQFLYGYHDMCMRLYGDLGTVDSHYGGDVSIRGKEDGWKGGNTGTIYRDGAVNNMKDFCAAIQAGKPINNAQEAANSTLTSILGRIAAHEGRPATWEDMMKNAKRLEADLDLPEDGPFRES